MENEVELYDLNGMDGAKRNFYKHINEWRKWRAALKTNDTQQEGWSHEQIDRYVLLARVSDWLAGHFLFYSLAINVALAVALAIVVTIVKVS